jgi:hypothetical protein
MVSAAARFKSPTEKLWEGNAKRPAEARRVPVSSPIKILVGKRGERAPPRSALVFMPFATSFAGPGFWEKLQGAN